MSESILHSCDRQRGFIDCPRPDKPFTDSDLLRRFTQERDQAAFEELVRRHGPVVMGVCRRVLDNMHDAEDAFQATFLVLAQKSSGIRNPELLGNWLYGVAFRIARKAKNSKPKCTAMPATEPAASRPGPDAALKELESVIDEELHRMPEPYRVLLTLCYFHGLSHAHVARELGWRPGSVSRRLAKAQKLLRARLTRRGLTVSAGLLALLLNLMGGSNAVSAMLVQSTSRAAQALASGVDLNSIVSLRVAALSQSAMKFPLTLLALLLASVLAIGPCGLAMNALRKAEAGSASQETAEQIERSRETSSNQAIAPSAFVGDDLQVRSSASRFVSRPGGLAGPLENGCRLSGQ